MNTCIVCRHPIAPAADIRVGPHGHTHVLCDRTFALDVYRCYRALRWTAREALTWARQVWRMRQTNAGNL